jgi:hypothetical protein
MGTKQAQGLISLLGAAGAGVAGSGSGLAEVKKGRC